VVSGSDWPVRAGTIASLVVLQSTTGPTLEALSDAAGSASAPKGGMQTGFGGAAALLAPHPVNRDGLIAAAALAALALSGGAVLLGRRHPRYLAVVAVAAAGVVGAGCGVVTSATGSPAHHVAVKATGSPATPTVGSPRMAPANTVSLAAADPAPAVSAPTGISIPSLGVSTSVVELGQNPDGTAQVPGSTDVAGWYADGPAPGQTGPAVILGHVDSYEGPGVFFRVRDLQPGAVIDVSEGASKLTFAVESVATYVKASFPTDAVFGPVPDRALRLITCGGPFDAATGHYQDNVVVYATEVGGG
jgi:sortase (surface protein transpeptidase)